MRQINRIFLHCTASSITGQNIAMINAWHLERGFKMCGYHYLINFMGFIEQGRPIEMEGAHCYGQNEDSIAVCLTGGKLSDFTIAQFKSLELVLRLLKAAFPKAELVAHNEFNKDKTCPIFDVAPWKLAWQNYPWG